MPAPSEAEERYGDYMDLVEEAEEELLALRDRYAETMAATSGRPTSASSGGGRTAAAHPGRPPRLQAPMEAGEDT